MSGTVSAFGTLTSGLLVGAAMGMQDPQEALKSVQDAALELEDAVVVRQLAIDAGQARFEIEHGVLVPAVAVGGRVVEAAFFGEAYFHLEPPDAIETAQLEMFTGKASVHEPVRQAIVVIGNPELMSRLLGGRETADLADGATGEIVESFATWRESVERRGFGVDAAVFKAAIGDSAFEDYFAIWCSSDELGRFLYQSDPTKREQVQLGRFVPFELDQVDKRRIDRDYHKQRRRGRYLQSTVEDLGHFDAWVRASLPDEAGRPVRGVPGFEPQHYELDISVAKSTLEVTGRVRVDLKVQTAGRRVVSFALFEDLEVDAVRDSVGRDQFWFRSGEDVHVLLAESAAAGETVSLELIYHGVLLDKYGLGRFALRDTLQWYPRTGAIDRATYDATLRWPAKYTLLASGSVEAHGQGQGMRWQQRRLNVPARAFSFEIGTFDVRDVQAGHVALTVAFGKAGSYFKGVKEQIVETLQYAIAFYEETFGRYPLDYLTVVTVPRDFSQGYLGFVTLAERVVTGRDPITSSLLVPSSHTSWADARTETITHELAHQWWGNKVGWFSYRDQWLSEALANYAAVRFTKLRVPNSDAYRLRRASEWRRQLARTTREGRTVEEIGPVVIGNRLRSSLTDAAYRAVVYEKGFVVFAMLARKLGEVRFARILRQLAGAVNNRDIDTETFFDAVERMAGVDLDPFTEQFVYGTGIPEVFYKATLEQGADGSRFLRGSAHLIGTPRYSYELVRTASSTWDVRRHRVEGQPVGGTRVVVPYQIAIGEADETERSWYERVANVPTVVGTMEMEGNTHQFEIPIAQHAYSFDLDMFGEVLAYFFSESGQPKRALRYKAMELPPNDAEPLLLQALSAPRFSETAKQRHGLTDRQVGELQRIEDGRINLELVRIRLDQGQVLAAKQSFEVAGKLLGRGKRAPWSTLRTVLGSRLDVREGRYETAYEALRRTLRLTIPRELDETREQALRRLRYATGRVGNGEAYALLAVSALETGNAFIAGRALEEAEKRGADMGALKVASPSR